MSTCKITYQGKEISCRKGANLRRVLFREKLIPHNGKAKMLNCKGFGSCGTCAVKIAGEISPMSSKEKIRLSLPPHNLKSGLRLACQVKVLGDLEVKKGIGFWGER